jgi:CRP-like cAMP-binding protein
MNNLDSALAHCALCEGYTETELLAALRQVTPTRREYARDQVIAIEGEECDSIGIVAQGSLRVERIFPSGKLVLIDLLSAGNSFGEAVLFSEADTYPATLTANEPSSVIFLSREDVVRLCASSPRFLNNFLRLLSNKILMLNRKIKTLSFQTVRQKVAAYLLEEASRQNTLTPLLPYSRRETADLLGLPRPSLSRELAAMQSAGWIDFDRRAFRLLQPEQLEASLQE